MYINISEVNNQYAFEYKVLEGYGPSPVLVALEDGMIVQDENGAWVFEVSVIGGGKVSPVITELAEKVSAVAAEVFSPQNADVLDLLRLPPNSSIALRDIEKDGIIQVCLDTECIEATVSENAKLDFTTLLKNIPVSESNDYPVDRHKEALGCLDKIIEGYDEIFKIQNGVKNRHQESMNTKRNELYKSVSNEQWEYIITDMLNIEIYEKKKHITEISVSEENIKKMAEEYGMLDDAIAGLISYNLKTKFSEKYIEVVKDQIIIDGMNNQIKELLKAKIDILEKKEQLNGDQNLGEIAAEVSEINKYLKILETESLINSKNRLVIKLTALGLHYASINKISTSVWSERVDNILNERRDTMRSILDSLNNDLENKDITDDFIKKCKQAAISVNQRCSAWENLDFSSLQDQEKDAGIEYLNKLSVLFGDVENAKYYINLNKEFGELESKLMALRDDSVADFTKVFSDIMEIEKSINEREAEKLKIMKKMNEEMRNYNSICYGEDFSEIEWDFQDEWEYKIADLLNISSHCKDIFFKIEKLGDDIRNECKDKGISDEEIVKLLASKYPHNLLTSTGNFKETDRVHELLSIRICFIDELEKKGIVCKKSLSQWQSDNKNDLEKVIENDDRKREFCKFYEKNIYFRSLISRENEEIRFCLERKDTLLQIASNEIIKSKRNQSLTDDEKIELNSIKIKSIKNIRQLNLLKKESLEELGKQWEIRERALSQVFSEKDLEIILNQRFEKLNALNESYKECERGSRGEDELNALRAQIIAWETLDSKLLEDQNESVFNELKRYQEMVGGFFGTIEKARDSIIYCYDRCLELKYELQVNEMNLESIQKDLNDLLELEQLECDVYGKV